MGFLVYNGERLDLAIEDRTLAHLQIVIINKLRKGESFAFSWKDSAESGDGRSTIWLAPTSSLHFKFAGSRAPEINAAWLQGLYATAESGKGLIIVDEPENTGQTALPEDAVVPIGVSQRPPAVARRAARPAGG
ncbi:ATP-dependent DNA ligase [Frondihabitans sp. PAMC 28766]|uniref:DUF7882 family protein n=1 Tax=Frondihabitans sp. PAMC 28766 TaxID=1795630 RepID=UPI001EF6EAC3|nr:ATP-dependent DNA ligase [Frondihabitans sp. PAMC 28766]